MANIFLSHPELLALDTQVAKYRIVESGNPAITLVENPIRPAGGGQPADHGTIVTGEGQIRIEQVIKSDGETWLYLPHGQLSPGDRIRVEVDANRRLRLSQGHSLTHLSMATAREVVPGYQSKGADIADNGAEIELRFLSSAPVTQEMIREIDRRTRSRIAKAIPIAIERARSMADAEASYSNWRVDPDLNLGGRIRVVVIDGVDANPCSGSHVASTDEIGPYAMRGYMTKMSGVNMVRIEKLKSWIYWF